MNRNSFYVVICLLILVGITAITAQMNQPPLPASAQNTGFPEEAFDPSYLQSKSFFAGDSLNVGLIGRWAYGPCLSVAGREKIAGFGHGGYLKIVDFSDPAQPKQLGEVLLPSFICGVAISGNYVYVANASAGLRIVDIRLPFQAEEVGFCPINDEALAVAVSGNYAYVAAGEAGLRVIDVSQPALPSEVGFLKINGWAKDICICGNYAYIAAYGGGLRVVDISQPQQPTEVGFYNLGGLAVGVATDSLYAYLADEKHGLRIIDVTQPTSPQEVGFYKTTGYFNSVFVAQNYAYLTNGRYGLWVVDVSQPTQPKLIGYRYIGLGPCDVVVEENQAYVAASAAGLHVIDVSQPDKPQPRGNYPTHGWSYGLALRGNYAYLANLHGGLRVLDISQPSLPGEVGFYDTPGYSHAVVLQGDHAFLAEDNYGVVVINITQPTQPVQVAHCDPGGVAQDIAIYKNHVLVATGSNGVRIIDITQPTQPQEVAVYQVDGYTKGVAVQGNYAYAAYGQAGLRIVDISQPTQPAEVGFYEYNMSASRVDVKGNNAYVVDNNAGLLIFDISQPQQPVKVGKYHSGGLLSDLLVSGTEVYLSDYFFGLRILNVSKPSQPIEVGYYATGGYARGVAINEKYIFVADDANGVAVLEFRNNPPAAPVLIQPPDGAILNETIPLVWTVPDDPDNNPLHFSVEIAFDSLLIQPIAASPFQSWINSTGFSPLPPIAAGSGTCQFSPPETLTAGDYWWRVTAWDGINLSQPSTTRKFILAAQPLLAVTPTNLDFDSTRSQRILQISNQGGGILNWHISRQANRPWLDSIVPDNGENDATVTIDLDRNQLVRKKDSAELRITSAGGNQTVDLQVTRNDSLFFAITYLDIRSTPLSADKINGSVNESNQIPTGTILVYQTSEGRFGKLKILKYDEYLLLKWLTYQSMDTTYNAGDSLLVKATCSYDLDTGNQVLYNDETSDFSWQYVSSSERYLTPLHNARFAIYDPDSLAFEVEPLTLDFGANFDTLTFQILKSGCGALYWNVTEQPDKAWLTTIDPASGLNQDTVRVVVDRNFLSTEKDTVTLAVETNIGTRQIGVFIEEKKLELPAHWDFTANTGNNAAVVLPTTANPNIDDIPLQKQDYIGIFTPAGRCCGYKPWAGQNLALTVWGDDDQTQEIDGFRPGELLHYRIFRLSEGREYATVTVSYAQGNGLYAPNAFMILNQFTASSGCARGDINLDEQITTTDVDCAFEIYLNGSKPVSNQCNNICARTAADVNCDGSITAGDALLIYDAYTQGQQPPLDCIPVNSDSNSGNQTGELILSLHSVNGSAGTEIQLPVQVNQLCGMKAFGLELNFPADLLEFVKIEATPFTENWYALAGQVNLAGVVVVGGFAPEPIYAEAGGELFVVHFKVKSGANGSGEFRFSNLTDDLASANVNSATFNTGSSAIQSPDVQLIPTSYALEQNYPNPFNMETEIVYQIPAADWVELTLYNSLGQHIRTLFSGNQSAGRYRTHWDGRDEQQHEVPSGIYFYQIETSRFMEIRKMVLLR